MSLAEADPEFSWGVVQHINASGKNSEGKKYKMEVWGGGIPPPPGSTTGLEDGHYFLEGGEGIGNIGKKERKWFSKNKKKNKRKNLVEKNKKNMKEICCPKN